MGLGMKMNYYDQCSATIILKSYPLNRIMITLISCQVWFPHFLGRHINLKKNKETKILLDEGNTVFISNFSID